MTARRHAGRPPWRPAGATALVTASILAGCGSGGSDAPSSGGAPAARPAGPASRPSAALAPASPAHHAIGVNVENGTLVVDHRRHYATGRVVRASVHGPMNAYSRAIVSVDWHPGADVWYGAGFLLPRGFRAAMQGEVDIMRWDNWPDDARHTDRGGVALFQGDGMAHLIRHRDHVEHVDLVPPFALPEGRWFWLEVHQRLAPDRRARNDVYLDGTLVASSRVRNSYGRRVRRVRYGIVASDTGVQTKPLRLWFARPTVSGRRIGPPPAGGR